MSETEFIKIDDLQVNRTYLIKHSYTVSSITVLAIAKKAIQVRWNNNLNTIAWELKEQMSFDYSVIEDITELMTEKPDIITIDFKQSDKWEQCHICKGFGTVPTKDTTSGAKMCPLCLGNKMIPKST
jgi:hypothetical protein